MLLDEFVVLCQTVGMMKGLTHLELNHLNYGAGPERCKELGRALTNLTSLTTLTLDLWDDKIGAAEFQ